MQTSWRSLVLEQQRSNFITRNSIHLDGLNSIHFPYLFLQLPSLSLSPSDPFPVFLPPFFNYISRSITPDVFYDAEEIIRSFRTVDGSSNNLVISKELAVW